MEEGGRGRARRREQAGDHATTRDLAGTEPSCHLQPVANIRPLRLGFIFLHLQHDSTAKLNSGQRMWVVQGESVLLSKPQKDQGCFMGNTGPEPQTSLLHGHPAFTKYQNTSWISQEPILMLFMPKREKTVIQNSSQSFFYLLFFLAPPPQAVVVI